MLFGLRSSLRLRIRRSRFNWSKVGLLALVGGLLWPGAATAQLAENRSVVFERFRLATDQGGIFDVEGADVPGHLSVDAAIWFGYQDDPLVLVGGDDRRGAVVASRWGGEGIVTVGLFGWISVALALPVVAEQSRSSRPDGVAGELAPLRGGVGDLRLSPKLRILRAQDFGVSLAVVSTFILPLGDDDAYLGDGELGFAPEMAISTRLGPVKFAFNLAYRTRGENQFLNVRIDDDIVGRTGIELDLSAVLPLQLAATGALAIPVDRDPENAEADDMSGEVFLGTVVRPLDTFALFGGVGIGVLNGIGTPDWRGLAGIRVSFWRQDSDGDGIQDREDRCPDVPEDRDGFRDEDGCPDLDDDHDCIPDVDDSAPLEAEDMDGFEDEDGAPDLDNDGDGILDEVDRCPNEAGPERTEGCSTSDLDQDAVIDLNDACPQQPEDSDGFEDDDGCPDVDNDGDGVSDVDDKCPLEPGSPARRGCPARDRDQDGVPDVADACVDEVGAAAMEGCAARPLVAIRQDRLIVYRRIRFVAKSSRLTARSRPVLDAVAELLLGHPEIELLFVEVHTDGRGPDSANLRITTKQAEAVVGYLGRKGVDPRRLQAVGFGEANPIDSDASAAGRRRNRRVELIIGSRRGP